MRTFLILAMLGLVTVLLPAQRSKSQTPTSKPSTTAPTTRTAPSTTSSTRTGSTDRQPAERKATRTSRDAAVYPAPSTTALTPNKTSATAERSTNPNSGSSPSQRSTGTTTGQGHTPPTKSTGSATAGTMQQATGTALLTEATKPLKVIKVNWMSIEEAMEKSKTEKKKIFIDVYTEWCGWCKRMDETTFTDPKVVKYLNDNFYAVKFDAEQKQDITFNGKTYHFTKVGNRGYHELAAEWLNNRMSYPTSVYLDEEFKVIQPLPGFLEAARFEAIINYFASDSYKRTPWESYEKAFSSGKNR